MATPIPWYNTPLAQTLLSGGALGVLTILAWIGGLFRWVAKHIRRPPASPILPPSATIPASFAPLIVTDYSSRFAPVFHVGTLTQPIAHPDDVEERDFYISVSDIITPMEQYLLLLSRDPEIGRSIRRANEQLGSGLRDHQRVTDPVVYDKLSSLTDAVTRAEFVFVADRDAQPETEARHFGNESMAFCLHKAVKEARDAIRVRTKEMRTRS